MAYLVTKFANLPSGAPNQRPETASEPRQGGNVPTTGRPSPAATGTYGTGPAGIEPATPRAETHATSCILEEKARLRTRKKQQSERKSGQTNPRNRHQTVTDAWGGRLGVHSADCRTLIPRGSRAAI